MSCEVGLEIFWNRMGCGCFFNMRHPDTVFYTFYGNLNREVLLLASVSPERWRAVRGARLSADRIPPAPRTGPICHQTVHFISLFGADYAAAAPPPPTAPRSPPLCCCRTVLFSRGARRCKLIFHCQATKQHQWTVSKHLTL